MLTKPGDLVSHMSAPAGDRPHIIVVIEDDGIDVRTLGEQAALSLMFLLLQRHIMKLFENSQPSSLTTSPRSLS